MSKIQNKRNITRDLIFVVGVVLLGKCMGFLRELVIAYLYGSSIETDAFYYVNGLILSIMSIITMGLGQAFTPVYMDIGIREGAERSRLFANKIVTVLLCAGFLLSCLLILFPHFFIRLLAPDMASHTQIIANHMLQIMGPCIPVHIAFSIRKCILNANNKYVVTEASGLPYSISIVFLTCLLFRPVGTDALPIAAIVGVISQFLFTLAYSIRDYRYKPARIHTNDPEIRNYIRLLIPIAFAAFMEEANGLLRKSLAGGIGDGAISNLNYCMTLTTLINGIVISSLSTVYFPHLIRNYSEKKFQEFKCNIRKCLETTSCMVIPPVLFLFLFSKEVVQIIYERGSFTHADTLEVSAIFSVYVLGSLVYAYRCIIRYAFYSAQDVRTPMLNEMCYLAVCMLLNVLQVKLFHMGLVSLGIAWVLSITVMTPIMFIQFRKKYFSIIDRPLIKETVKVVTASVISIGTAYTLYHLLSISNLFLGVATAFCTAVVIYFTILFILKSTLIEELRGIL